MGEIKSTLDLVMEKTRNMKLSDEEKRAQKQSEIASRIKGIMQKLQDGLISEDQFKIDYETLKKEVGRSDDGPLINEIFARLDPVEDTALLLNILEDCCGLETDSISSMIEDYRESYQQAARVRLVKIKERLAQKYLITGTAVVPNLDADEEWQRQLQDMRGHFEDRLRQVKAKQKDRPQ
jgi:hypothetical protein